MLNINKTIENGNAIIELEGRLDTTTSPELERIIREILPGLTSLLFDFEKAEYISSAGLRVLLVAQKAMNSQGKMIVQNVNETIMEIFEITGFIDILTIEN